VSAKLGKRHHSHPLQQDRFAQLSETVLKIRGKWIIREASTVHKELLALEIPATENSSTPSSIDMAELESIDLSGIQLLLSYRKQFTPAPSIDISSNESVQEWLSLCEAR
jgi:anti-anti-sigma regulatory factor